MDSKTLFVVAFSLFVLFAAAPNAQAGGAHFSFGLSIGFGHAHYAPYAYYYPGPIYRLYAYEGPYYRASYPVPAMGYYCYSPYRYRVYRSYAPRYRQHGRPYAEYQPRRYYRR